MEQAEAAERFVGRARLLGMLPVKRLRPRNTVPETRQPNLIVLNRQDDFRIALQIINQHRGFKDKIA